MNLVARMATHKVVALLSKLRRTRLLIGQSPLAHHGDSLVRRRHEFRFRYSTTYKCHGFGALLVLSLLLLLLLLPLPKLERRSPWCSAGVAANALTSMMTTICIFDIATDDMPHSRVSASSPHFYSFFSLLSPFPSSRPSTYCKSMDTHLHHSRRQALAPNCASVSGDSV
jgi:hypothetical protein